MKINFKLLILGGIILNFLGCSHIEQNKEVDTNNLSCFNKNLKLEMTYMSYGIDRLSLTKTVIPKNTTVFNFKKILLLSEYKSNNKLFNGKRSIDIYVDSIRDLARLNINIVDEELNSFEIKDSNKNTTSLFLPEKTVTTVMKNYKINVGLNSVVFDDKHGQLLLEVKDCN